MVNSSLPFLFKQFLNIFGTIKLRFYQISSKYSHVLMCKAFPETSINIIQLFHISIISKMVQLALCVQ